MELLFIIATMIIGALSLLLIVAILRQRRAAITNHGHVKWVEAQLKRALAQIGSRDEKEVLAGFQMLAMLNKPSVRMQALGRISELAGSENPTIAKYAQITRAKILEDLSRATEGPEEEVPVQV